MKGQKQSGLSRV